MFILMHHFAELARTQGTFDSAEHLIATLLGRTGPAITITTLINFSAFLMGQVIGVTLVVDFCTTCAVALLFIFVIQVGFPNEQPH